MCRRNQLRGGVLLGIGLGLVIGYCLESWLLCCCGGVGLLLVGLCMMNRK